LKKCLVPVFSDGSRRFAQGFLPFALRANLRLSNFWLIILIKYVLARADNKGHSLVYFPGFVTKLPTGRENTAWLALMPVKLGPIVRVMDWA
ncbi:MAG: hypothetical protein OEY07_16340, partial [Gammaproteobacteria bacterium]|nr:hypothetical protein [Gammaproteobacteria bacterium]